MLNSAWVTQELGVSINTSPQDQGGLPGMKLMGEQGCKDYSNHNGIKLSLHPVYDIEVENQQIVA